MCLSEQNIKYLGWFPKVQFRFCVLLQPSSPFNSNFFILFSMGCFEDNTGAVLTPALYPNHITQTWPTRKNLAEHKCAVYMTMNWVAILDYYGKN
jgi:hypothetical protein